VQKRIPQSEKRGDQTPSAGTVSGIPLMFKWLFIVVVISLSLATYEIYRYGSYAGLGIGIILFPGIIGIQWMIAYFLLPRNHDNDSESATRH